MPRVRDQSVPRIQAACDEDQGLNRPEVRFIHSKGQECLPCHLCGRVHWRPWRGFSLPQAAPGCRVVSWISRSEQLEPDAAAGGKSRAEPTDRQPPCLLLQPASSHLNLSPLHPTLHPGRNVSRSCTEAGWTPLEPGPYPVACGLDDNSSSLDEVGLHAPHARTHTHTHMHISLYHPPCFFSDFYSLLVSTFKYPEFDYLSSPGPLPLLKPLSSIIWLF